jgi:hypothetical protein
VEELSAEELHCLQALAGPARHPFSPCRPALLDSLSRRGLVTMQSQQWWPLGNPYGQYILTPAGRRLLEQLKG